MEFDRLIQANWGRSLATLIRLCGDFDAAENALQEACVIAWQQWSRDDAPANPSAWLVATARHKLLDARRTARRRAAREREWGTQRSEVESLPEVESFPDDPLRLIFTCCHPAIALEAQVALTLRTLSGLTTEEIARAFLVDPAAMAQRLVRAKRKIRAAGIPYQTPASDQLAERLIPVCAVLYLVFNEGYAATSGERLIRADLCDEAIRLTRIVVELLPQAERPRALLALMLLHHARRRARLDGEGVPVLLEDQDRSLWDAKQIAEGLELTDALVHAGSTSDLTLEAAIASLHMRAPTAAETPWRKIAALYELRYREAPSPVVLLNRAVAIAMADGIERGLALIDQLAASGALREYHLLPAARAGLLWRAQRCDEAAASYREALEHCRNEPERRFIQKRLSLLEAT
jgi:RNA polymerase sigma-70 factor (ECF subfamily)